MSFQIIIRKINVPQHCKRFINSWVENNILYAQSQDSFIYELTGLSFTKTNRLPQHLVVADENDQLIQAHRADGIIFLQQKQQTYLNCAIEDDSSQYFLSSKYQSQKLNKLQQDKNVEVNDKKCENCNTFRSENQNFKNIIIKVASFFAYTFDESYTWTARALQAQVPSNSSFCSYQSLVFALSGSQIMIIDAKNLQQVKINNMMLESHIGTCSVVHKKLIVQLGGKNLQQQYKQIRTIRLDDYSECLYMQTQIPCMTNAKMISLGEYIILLSGISDDQIMQEAWQIYIPDEIAF